MNARFQLVLYRAPGCKHCDAAAARITDMLSQRGLDESLEIRSVLEHLDSAVAAGVRATPALVVNGRAVASGSINTRLLQEALATAASGEET